MKAALALVLLASTAVAAPFKETLPKSELDAMLKAIQSGLPPVDQNAVSKTCTPGLDEYNKDPVRNTGKLPAIAKCMRTAGALGAAVTTWKTYEKNEPDAAKRKEAIHELATTLEAGAMFDQAADYDEKYAKAYPKEADAQERYTRALCIRRQLGDAAKAKADADGLTKLFKAKPDAKVCDTVRPIVSPTAKTN